ncbi:ABC transporter transmembrane domain-containing protein [Ammoniphilus sp. CFH 90114]|uniref:ABC transporter transmembrane domain-containing protein n=1 Tax=Ammoniphilus sp. CFH 90114 TaxID=2493665 RepID=UPI00100F66CE|nr:ABC transporter transmembrane domain-containing protein [Ammoniphilus sp. CFH 90114]RXT04204.1 ATP-binding cassette domain-containing protein [Ammoniphilus sp. CFH 90114]
MNIFLDLMWYFKQEKSKYLVGVVVLFLVSLLNLLPPYIVGRIVDDIRIQTLSYPTLFNWLLLILAIAITVYGLRYLWRIMIFGSAIRLGMLLRNRLYEHFTKLSPRFYHKRRIGDLMAHSTNDVQAVQMTAGEGVLTLVDSIIMGGLVILTMGFIHWKLTLIALLPMPIMVLATSYYGTLLHKRFHEAQASFSHLNDRVQENISGVRVIKAFGQEEAEKRQFEQVSKQVVEKNMGVARIDALFDPTISFIVGFSFILTVGFGAYFVVHDSLTIGQLTTFTIYLGHLIWPMLAFGWLFNIVEKGRASYDRISHLLEIQPEVVSKEGAMDHMPVGSLQYDLDSFAYPDHQEPSLQSIHLSLERGQTLGIVGRTGSGKTTFLRLLLREFDLDSNKGDIRIGAHSIYDVKIESLRRAIGYVPQDHYLFSASISDNIAFGKPEATQAEIEQAAAIASVHKDILRFEHGYDTVVGERGVTLSGGQKQRISIARALLIDPEILILDDSLSAVDARTEERILHSLRETRKDRTTIISAHRLSAIQHADLIIVLEEGRVLERGNHASLLQENGWYASMYRRQQLEDQVEQGGKST